MSERIAVFKLCVFGDSGVGKTTLTHRYMHNVFELSLKMTIGIDFYVRDVEIQGKVVALRIWDFGGEERYRILFPSFAKGTDGGIFMYDTTRDTTLNNMNEWLSFFKEHGQKDIKIPILMVGGKTDLEENRSVPTEDAQKLMERYNLAGNYECSSKTGENLELIFETITRLMMENAGLL